MQGETAPLDVEVSLVNTNNSDFLRACLASLPEAAGALSWHATVVDNASDDGSPEVVRLEFPWARLIENGQRVGFSANHNQIIADVVNHDSARYVLVLNEDTELEPGSLEKLVSFADRENRLGAAGPRLVETDGREQVSYFRFPSVLEQFWSTMRPGQSPRPAETAGWLNGSCLLVRTEALRRVGPLDARFFIFFEDTDLGLRLHRAGWRSAVCASSRVVHHGHQTVSQSRVGTHMERQMLRSRYIYFRKHHGRQTAAVVVALVRMALGVRAAKAFLAGSIRGDGGERRLAGLLWSLARYDPVTPLPHESMATGVTS
jgi:N-acetylglucosaminyl-diphospho-decaprenol L-rhamnosyltransferase